MLPLAAQRDDFDFDRLFHTPHELDLARAAALFELDYEPVDSIAALEDALDRALARSSVSVVHVRVDARENERRFRDGVRPGLPGGRRRSGFVREDAGMRVRTIEVEGVRLRVVERDRATR